MIRDIFMPKVLGSYYLFPQIIVGFDIGKTFVQAAVVKAYKNERVLQKLIREKISDENSLNYQESVTGAISKIMSEVGAYDLVYSSLPAGLVIFKELTVPFVDLDKIALVVPFEIDALLPFSLDEADVDFIITRTYPGENKSDIVVAAIKKEQKEKHVQLFLNAGIQLERISVDLFELYALYKITPFYAENSGIVALVDTGFYATRVAIIVDGQLKHIRSLSRGILSLAQDSREQLLVFEKEKIQQFMLDIQFTLQPYVDGYAMSIDPKIIFTGHGAEIKDFVEVMRGFYDHSSELFNWNKVLQSKNIIVAPEVTVTQGYMVSIALALGLSATRHVNFDKTLTVGRDTKLLEWQIGFATILTLCIILLLTGNIWYIKRSYTKEIDTSSQEVLTTLKTNFTKFKQIKGKYSLTKANSLAEDELKKEEAILSQLLHKNKISFLACLEELSRRIDRESLGLDLEKLILNEYSGQIILEGKVRGYKELATLEQSLRRSKMLIFVGPKLQETSFEIKLHINEEYGVS